MAIRIAGSALGLVVAAVLVRLLGANEFGRYILVLSIVMVLTIPAQIGLPQFVVRETAKAVCERKNDEVRAVWGWSQRFVVFISTLIVVGIGGWYLFEDNKEIANTTLVVGVFLVPLISLNEIRSAALRGLGHVLLGQMPGVVVRPSVFLLLIFGIYICWKQPVTSQVIMTANVAAAGVTFILITLVLHYKAQEYFPKTRSFPITRNRGNRAWLISAINFGALSSFSIINNNLDIIMIGVFRPIDDVAVYKVVTVASSVLVLGLGAINVVIMPHLARFHQSSNREELQQTATHTARLTLGFAAAVFTIYLIFGGSLLGFAFSKDFERGYAALMILIVGQLINAGFGSVGPLLNMGGHERDTMIGVGLAAVINASLNALLIPRWGIEGAAIATAMTILVWNMFLSHRVWRRYGIQSAAFTFGRRE